MIQFDPNIMKGELRDYSESNGKRYQTIRIWNDNEALYYNDLIVSIRNVKMCNEYGSQLASSLRSEIKKSIIKVAETRSVGVLTDVFLIDGQLYTISYDILGGEILDITPLEDAVKSKTVITYSSTWANDRLLLTATHIYNSARALVMLVNNQGLNRHKNYTQISKYKPSQIRNSTVLTEEQKVYILERLDRYYALFSKRSGAYIGLFPRDPIQDNRFTDEQITNINYCLKNQYGLRGNEPYVQIERKNYLEVIQNKLKGVTLC